MKSLKYEHLFYLHIPYSTEYTALTPKNPEGRVYSGIIRSKSNEVGWLRGFPNLMRTQLNGIKCVIFLPVTVISCERAFFRLHLDDFIGCKKQILNTALNRSLNTIVM